MHSKILFRKMHSICTLLLFVILTLTNFNVIFAAPTSSSSSQVSNTDLQDKQYRNGFLDNIVAESKISPYYNDESKESNEVEDNKAVADRIMSLLKSHQRVGGSKNWMLRQALLQDRQHKRQIRYQQCYFNPISCF